MIDSAYDISYLLDAEPARVAPPVPRVVAAPVPRKPSQAELQEAMARQLLQADVVHEAMVQQYLRMYGLDDQIVERR